MGTSVRTYCILQSSGCDRHLGSDILHPPGLRAGRAPQLACTPPSRTQGVMGTSAGTYSILQGSAQALCLREARLHFQALFGFHTAEPPNLPAEAGTAFLVIWRITVFIVICSGPLCIRSGPLCTFASLITDRPHVSSVSSFQCCTGISTYFSRLLAFMASR